MNLNSLFFCMAQYRGWTRDCNIVFHKRAAAWPVEVNAALQQAAAKRKATQQAMKDDEETKATAVSFLEDDNDDCLSRAVKTPKVRLKRL